MSRRLNYRLVKIHRNYSVEEIARLFSRHKNSVRNWVRQGLPTIDDGKPILVLGSALRRFLRDRGQRARQRCGPGEMYCVRCRAVKRPGGDFAECHPINPSSAKFRDFRKFHIQQAISFKAHLVKETNARTGGPLSKATLLTTVSALKGFFQWLSDQPGYRSRHKYVDADYFDLSEKDMRVARAHREQRVPTLEQIRHVIANMPVGSEIERRNRAVLAFTIVTGARDGAIASFKLKHIAVADERLDHDAREVKTKASKTFTTNFFPVGDDLRQIVVEWVAYLRTVKRWEPDDPLFPATKVVQGDDLRFEARGLERAHWQNAEPIRKIFRQAFERAGIPYANPHSFRKTLARLGEQRCRTPEEFKAWSQNLGHDHVATTLTSYGEVPRDRQATIMRSLADPNADGEDLGEVQRMLEAATVALSRRRTA